MSKILCLDPGHGGYDTGAVGNGLMEKTINLTIALGVKQILEAAGVTVVMTRETDASPDGTTDVNTDLADRCKISNEAHADLFLSIHTNAGGGNGAEIYVMGNGGDIHSLASDVVNAVASIMGVHGEPIKDGSSLYVINSTEAPAMLLEVGYIDSSDADKLRSNLPLLAEKIAGSLMNWLGGIVPAAKAVAAEGEESAPALEAEPVNDYSGSPFEPYIQWIIKEGIMIGDGNGHFRPHDPITREELAVVVKRIFDHLNPSAE